MNFFERKDNCLYFRGDGELVRLSPWGQNAIRVESALMDQIPAGEIALLKAESVQPEISLLDERHAKMRNGKITANLFVQPWGNGLQITFTDRAGKVLLQEISDGGALTRKARSFQHLSGGNYRLKATFAADSNEKIFGMGQYQQEIFNLKGCNLELAHRNSQASIPFYLSDLGYGFLWHNAAIGEVHFGLNTTEWVAQSTKKLDYWITAGDSPSEIKERFAAVTGKVPMMPEYGLGFWQCKLRYYEQEQVLSVAREYKKRGIPVDVIVIDYYHWPRCGDWRFDTEYFPDPKAMVSELRGR